jgi:hypothetical protein
MSWTCQDELDGLDVSGLHFISRRSIAFQRFGLLPGGTKLMACSLDGLLVAQWIACWLDITVGDDHR